jgi:hypothetical protein
MISSAPNPFSLPHCLPGRACYPCALAPSDVVAIPIYGPNCRPQSLLLRPTTRLRLLPQLLATADKTTHLSPEPQTTTLETEQYPLKIDLPAKV